MLDPHGRLVDGEMTRTKGIGLFVNITFVSRCTASSTKDFVWLKDISEAVERVLKGLGAVLLTTNASTKTSVVLGLTIAGALVGKGALSSTGGLATWIFLKGSKLVGIHSHELTPNSGCDLGLTDWLAAVITPEPRKTAACVWGDAVSPVGTPPAALTTGRMLRWAEGVEVTLQANGQVA